MTWVLLSWVRVGPMGAVHSSAYAGGAQAPGGKSEARGWSISEYSVGMRSRAAHVAAVLLLAFGAGEATQQAVDLTIDGPAGSENTAQRIRDIDQARLAEALRAAGLELPARIHLTLVTYEDPRAHQSPAWVVGRAWGFENIEIFPERVTTYPYDSLESVVRHEIVHLALNARSGGAPLPRWFHEGVAVSVETGWGFRDQARLLVAALERPTISDVNRLFASDSRPETTQAYLLSAALIDDIRERHGPAVPGAIAAGVGAGLPFDRAFAMETGETVDETTARAWAAYRRLSRWLPVLTSPLAVWGLILALSFVAFFARLRRRLEQRRRWDEQWIEDPSPGDAGSADDVAREDPWR